MTIPAISTTPALAAILLLFWIWIGARSYRRNWLGGSGLAALAAWLAALGLWGLATVYFAQSGYYRSARFLELFPGLWWPLIPMVITAGLLVLPTFRDALRSVAVRHRRSLVLVQGLRCAAAGGVMKGFIGLLPPSFALPIGIPDLLFGLSAVALAALWPRHGWSARTLIAWNLIGIAVILPAPVLMQLGLPGQLQVFNGTPDARVLFDYPMVLAPTFIVPLLITMNAIQAATLWLDANEPVTAPTAAGYATQGRS